jgi:hypothetical protein
MPPGGGRLPEQFSIRKSSNRKIPKPCLTLTLLGSWRELKTHVPDSSESLYMVTIPPGVTSFSISTSGGTGDVDLFLKRGQAALCQVSDSVSQICSKDDSSDVNDIGFFSLRRAKDAPVRG